MLFELFPDKVAGFGQMLITILTILKKNDKARCDLIYVVVLFWVMDYRRQLLIPLVRLLSHPLANLIELVSLIGTSFSQVDTLQRIP